MSPARRGGEQMTMKRRGLGALAPIRLIGPILLIGVVSTSGPAAATAISTAGHGPLVPASAGQTLPVRNADTSSLNWSGYAVVGQAGHPITAVTQSWIVPTVSLAPPGFSSTWAGIGGYNTSDLIQAGTESDTAQTPYAW